jgi:hypothetical protein
VFNRLRCSIKDIGLLRKSLKDVARLIRFKFSEDLEDGLIEVSLDMMSQLPTSSTPLSGSTCTVANALPTMLHCLFGQLHPSTTARTQSLGDNVKRHASLGFPT